MKLAVISDVHGNRVALDAVLADAAAVGVDRWWCLGDLAAIGPEPVATLEILANIDTMVCTSGNTDRYVLTGDRPFPSLDDVRRDTSLLPRLVEVEGSFAWTRGALSAAGWLEWLASLPADVRVDLPDGTRVLGVHATPGRDDGRGITPHRDEDDLRAALDGADAELIIGGHTHLVTDRWVDGVRALNGGSLSNPITDDRRASYLVIHADRHGHRVEHRRVAYDVDAFLATLDRSGHPSAEYVASFQRGEQVRHRAWRPPESQ